jgi:hypothetical protein
VKQGNLGRGLPILLLVFALGLLFAAVELAGGEPGPAHSATSSDRDGRRALYLFLEELGIPCEVWRDPPGRLPRGRNLLLLPAAPPEPPDHLRRMWADLDARPDGAAEVRKRLRDPAHYLRFVEEGGVLFAGLDEERAEFLGEALGVDLAGLSVEARGETDAGAEQAIVSRSGELLTLDWSDHPRFSGGARFGGELPGSRVLLADAAAPERAVALALELGRGELVLLCDDRLLDNRTLGRGDNALAHVRLIEEFLPLDPGGALLLDEYALGVYAPDSAVALAFGGRSRALTLQVLLILGLALWWLAASGPFPRDPEVWAQASPAALARAEAGWLVRHREYGSLADAHRRAALAEPGLGALGPERRGVDAWDPRRVEQALVALVRSEPDPERRPGLAAALERPVTNAEELAKLTHAIDRLAELARAARGAGATPRGKA